VLKFVHKATLEQQEISEKMKISYYPV